MKEAGKQRKQLRKTDGEWQWQKRYRVWDADRKIFLYPENWIEPELRLPTRFRISLGAVAAFICVDRGAKIKREPIRVLFTGKNRIGALVAAQTLARDLEKNLYRVDLSRVVSKYIGETEKNLRRIFAAVKGGGAVLFLDEADALFGKRVAVHDSHDRYANVEINYLLKRIEEYAGVAILATSKRTRIDNAFSRRFHFVIRVPLRRKPCRKQSSVR
jgi:ATPase family associated with various cellular activities (AAA)/ABC toxin N-terminal region